MIDKETLLKRSQLSTKDIVDCGLVSTKTEVHCLRNREKNNLPYLRFGKKIVYITEDVIDFFNLKPQEEFVKIEEPKKNHKQKIYGLLKEIWGLVNENYS